VNDLSFDFRGVKNAKLKGADNKVNNFSSIARGNPPKMK